MEPSFSRAGSNLMQYESCRSFSKLPTVTRLLSDNKFFSSFSCFNCGKNPRDGQLLKKSNYYFKCSLLMNVLSFSSKARPANSFLKVAHNQFNVEKNRRSVVTAIKSAEVVNDRNRPVSFTEVKRILRQQGLRIDDGHVCINTSLLPLCFGVEHKKKQSACNLFINKTTGFFVCPACEASGPWNILEQALLAKRKGRIFSAEDLFKYGLTRHSSTPKESSQIMKDAICVASVLSDESSPQFPAVQRLIHSLGLEKINIAVLKQLDVKINSELTSLLFPLRAFPHGALRGIKTLRLKRESGNMPPKESEYMLNDEEIEAVEETVPLNDCNGLFGWVKSSNKKEAILVASVRDVLAISSSIPNTLPLCLPHGSTTLSQSLLPAFESFSKITLWFGRNPNGLWDDPHMHARKLGEDRCYFVRPTDSHPSPWEGVQQGAALPKVLSGARCIAHPCITTFETLREDVLAEIQNVEKVKGVKWKRFPALTRILQGHRRGELTILTGPTGSGKTTLMSEYSLDLCQQGVSTLWGSFEIRNTRLARAMLQQMVGEPLEGKTKEEFDFWADQLASLPLYFMTFHGQQSLKVVMEAVHHAVYVHDIAHVVVDNVQFMLGMGESETSWGSKGGNPGISDRFWRQDMVVAAFRKFATTADCHVTLVIHPRKERDCEDLTSNSIFGGVKASQEADNVLIIQDKRLSSVRGKKYLQVAKNRYSGDLGVVPLEYDKESLSYGKKKRHTSKLGGSPESSVDTSEFE